MQHYDFIIAGGGCAGLSLAYRLVTSPLRDRSILIIDRDDKDQNDRTWAFWTDRPTPFQPVVLREWDRLRIITEEGEKFLPTAPWRYVMIRGDDWYRHIREMLARCPNVTWIKAPVKRIEDGPEGAVVWFDPDAHGPEPVKPCRGTWVFDSMFNINAFRPAPSTRYLQQHFKGWYIETPEDHFDVSAATLFDFRTPQEGELRFFYVLPTSPRSALVEYVGLSLVDFDTLLDRYIREVLGVRDYTVVSDEIGITPMTDHLFPRRAGAAVMNAGIQGGLAKPTTGYAYTRIQDDTAAIVASLCEYGQPFNVPPTSKAIYRWLDSVMLDVMRHEPTRLKATFQRMFSRNPGPRIFRFLDERASVGDALELILTLPKLPFVAGAARVALAAVRPRRPAPFATKAGGIVQMPGRSHAEGRD
jgi:lycopene beta-cyclase